MRLRRLFATLLTLGLALPVVGCATTHQTRSVEQSGFLGDYSQLGEGEGDQALFVYANPKANWKKYSKVMLDKPVIYAAPDSDLGKVEAEDRQALLSYLDASFREQLGKDYAIVDQAGDDVMRIRLAITNAKGSKVVMDTMSSIMPIGIALSTLKRIVTGTHSAVGTASIEGEILDSKSGERLFAAVDERAGTKAFRSKFGTWNHVQESFDWWAERTRTRLAELKAK